MQKFEYRGPRFHVDLPVRLKIQGSILIGHCTEISKEGITVVVDQPLASRSSGTVSLTYQGRTIDFGVRVAHVDGMHSGLEFIYSSGTEREAIAQLVDFLASQQNLPGPVLVKNV
jgi:hypothetical protein